MCVYINPRTLLYKMARPEVECTGRHCFLYILLSYSARSTTFLSCSWILCKAQFPTNPASLRISTSEKRHPTNKMAAASHGSPSSRIFIWVKKNFIGQRTNCQVRTIIQLVIDRQHNCVQFTERVQNRKLFISICDSYVSEYMVNITAVLWVRHDIYTCIRQCCGSNATTD